MFLLLLCARLIYGVTDYVSNYQIPYLLEVIPWRSLALCVQGVGIGLLFILVHQRVIKGRDKYLIIVIYFFFLSMAIIPYNSISGSFSILLNLLGLFIPLSYGYTAVKSKGNTRKKACYIALAMIIYAIGNLLTSSTFRLMVIDSHIMTDFDYSAILFLVMMISCWLLFIGFNMKIPDEEIELLGIEESLVKAVGLDLSRRSKITEDEISISKEKKICLVCKGKVLGISFICRNCEAFYCVKCYNALITLENACWSCNKALDESKPVKTAEKEKILLQEEPSKLKG